MSQPSEEHGGRVRDCVARIGACESTRRFVIDIDDVNAMSHTHELLHTCSPSDAFALGDLGRPVFVGMVTAVATGRAARVVTLARAANRIGVSMS